MREHVPKITADVRKNCQQARRSYQNHETVTRMREQVPKITSDVLWEMREQVIKIMKKLQECVNKYPKWCQMCEEVAKMREQVATVMKK